MFITDEARNRLLLAVANAVAFPVGNPGWVLRDNELHEALKAAYHSQPPTGEEINGEAWAEMKARAERAERKLEMLRGLLLK
jgi:hypothetical protein